jgi:hypothetical protein
MLVSGCNSTEDMDLLYFLGLESEDDRRHAGNALVSKGLILQSEHE